MTRPHARGLIAAAAILAFAASGVPAQPLSPLEELGKRLFFDTNLSTPPGQSCAACHAPQVGFTGPDAAVNAGGGVYPGAVANRFGNRKPPAAAYGGASPIMHFDTGGGMWIGGMFWDGRATGWTLGDPLAEQAQGPFLNPLEQNIPSAKQVVTIVSQSAYANLFTLVWGPGSLDDIAAAYEKIARSIAAYERSAEVNPFSSKYDYYLKGQVKLTRLEREGLRLYEGRAKCAACHPSRVGPNGEPPLFTDFTYDNLGIPRNPKNPFYKAPTSINPDGPNWVDPGLGGFLAGAGYASHAAANWGKHKVPTLRNVDRRPDPGFVKAFGHNAYFKSLESIVHFYNTRDVGSWPPPEVAVNLNRTELGNLGLSAEEETAIVAFLGTLSDGYVLPSTARKGARDSATPIVESGLGITGPNPFRTSTRLSYALSAPGRVVIDAFDVAGRRVETLFDGWLPAGRHAIQWTPRDLSPGLYLVRVHTTEGSSLHRVALIR